MCWEGLGAGGEGEDRGWDGRMASLTQWTWVSVNSGSWWWTGRPGVLRFMGSQRVRHDWATDLIWSEVQSIDIPERINHFNLWPILLLVICMLILSCTSCLYVLEMNPLWISPLPNIFSYSEDCPCLSLRDSFRHANAFKVNSVPLSDLWFIFHYSKRWTHKEFAAFYVRLCPVYIFLSNFIVSIITFGYLCSMGFVFVVMMFSNFILIFMVEGILTVSSRVAVPHLLPKHQWRRVTLSAHLLQHWLFAECLTMAIPPGVMWYLIVVWNCISLMLVMLTSFHVIFLECDLNLHLEIGFFNTCLVSDSFSMTTPRTVLEYECFLLTAPGSLWILNSWGTALSGVIT